MPITSLRFQACMPFVYAEEGGWSNTAGDHGGATDLGIIQTEYNIFRHSKGLPLQSVRLITKSESDEIYWSTYWMPHCAELPAGLDLSVMNINVNGGDARGTRLIQKCLAITVDGIWGKATSAAVINLVAAGNVERVIRDFHDDERAFYAAIIAHDPSQQKFASDWFGRNDRCEKLSLSMFNAGELDSALDASAKPQPSIIKGGPNVRSNQEYDYQDFDCAVVIAGNRAAFAGRQCADTRHRNRWRRSGCRALRLVSRQRYEAGAA